MAFGASLIHGYPTPLDTTPLSAETWEKLVEALGAGVPFEAASLSEQNAYVAAMTAKGLGPSSTNILRVTRTDLDNLVMSNDGYGFRRDSGGFLSEMTHANLHTVESAGAVANRGTIGFDLPCRAGVQVLADVTGEPPGDPDSWAFWAWLETGDGVQVGPRRVYSNLPRIPYFAFVSAVADMPAGPGSLHLWTQVHPDSGPITWAAVGLTVSYA